MTQSDEEIQDQQRKTFGDLGIPLPIIHSDFEFLPLTEDQLEMRRLRRQLEATQEANKRAKYQVWRGLMEEAIESLIKNGVLPNVPYTIQLGDEVE